MARARRQVEARFVAPVNDPEPPADESTVKGNYSPSELVAHDVALSEDPDAHPTDCAICADQQEPSVEDTAALDAANKRADDAERQLAELKAAQDADGVKAAHDAELEAKDKEIDGLTVQLGAAEQRAEAAEQKVTDITAYLEAEAQAQADAAALEDRKTERKAALDALAEAAPDGPVRERIKSRIETRLGAYAAMADDEWTEALADLKALAPDAGPAPKKDPIPGAANAAAVLGGALPAGSIPANDADEDPFNTRGLKASVDARKRG